MKGATNFSSELLYDKLQLDDLYIRLLTPLPKAKAKGLQLLEFTLNTVQISNAPKYTTLSYCWRNPFPSKSLIEEWRFFPDEIIMQRRMQRDQDWESPIHPIVCNDSLVYVRLNLFEALRHWEKRRGPEHIWIDALCINQADHTEKGNQVQLMGQIYSKAEDVLVWLGPSGYENQLVRQLLNDFEQLSKAYYEDDLVFDDFAGHDPRNEGYRQEWGLDGKRAAYHPAHWAAFVDLFRRTWFHRRWTLQEVALARQSRLVCGLDDFDWREVKFLATYMYFSGWREGFIDEKFRGLSVTNKPGTVLGPIVTLDWALDSTLSKPWKQGCVSTYGEFNAAAVLIELLSLCKGLQATERCDVVFALDSLVRAISGTGVTDVDYSVGPERLFQKVAEYCICETPSLAFLSFVQDDYRLRKSSLPVEMAMPDLPSWVPRFIPSEERLRLCLSRYNNKEPLYNSGFRPGSRPERCIVKNFLHLRGYHLGNVDACCASRGFDNDMLDFIDCLPLMINGVPMIRALWRTFVCDKERTKRPAPPDLGGCFVDYMMQKAFLWPEKPSKAAIQERLLKVRRIIAKISPKSVEMPDFELESSIYQRLLDPNLEEEELAKPFQVKTNNVFRFEQEDRARTGMFLFRTGSGNIGLGPLSQQVGDQVWVLENGRVPFILRPSRRRVDEDDGKLCFELLEECFFMGFMDGESIKDDSIGLHEICLV